MINVPDILFTDDDVRIDSEKINIEYYFNTKSNLYEMAKCSRYGDGTSFSRKDFYLLRDGLRGLLQNRSGLDQAFNVVERHSGAIYISRPTKPIILNYNTFEENIGFVGGAVSINSPNFSAVNDPYGVSTMPTDFVP